MTADGPCPRNSPLTGKGQPSFCRREQSRIRRWQAGPRMSTLVFMAGKRTAQVRTAQSTSSPHRKVYSSQTVILPSIHACITTRLTVAPSQPPQDLQMLRSSEDAQCQRTV